VTLFPYTTLFRSDHSYCCYEPSPSLARALREKGVTVREACAPPLLEPDCSQQAVIALHVLEHVRDGNEALHFFAEASRVLAPGGIFFVISPDYNDMGKLFFDVDYTHGYVTTPNRLSQLARDAGFVIDKRKFLYGAVPAFPGLLLNLIVKALFFFSRCLRENTCFEIRGIAKLEYLFSRAVVFICRKPVSATAK
jgi:SAM-dependent methyltransferase